MLFVIERPRRIYRGTIMLSPVKNCLQARAVHIREYAYRDDGRNQGEIL